MIKRSLFTLVISACLLQSASLVRAQGPAQTPAAGVVAPPHPPRPQFFAGLVVEADANHLKVSRHLPGRAPETHIFTIDSKTRTPKGGIKLKSRVTVRYQRMADEDLALEIQVRSPVHAPKPS